VPAPRFTVSGPRRGHRRVARRGQSIVEFTLILPILIILVLATVDLARIYSTMLTVESAAREAADYGTFGSQRWDPAVYAVVPDGTEAGMLRRACVASSTLPDYVGPDDSCTNPAFSYELSGDRGATWQAFDPGLACDDPVREPPCWVRVTLRYDFRLVAPLSIDLFGVTLGLPNTLTFERTSTFPMTDLALP
jgi:hypothetical protein